MIIFLLIVLGIYLLQRKIKFNVKIPDGLTLIFANKGTGKTTVLAKMAEEAMESGRYKAIYSNVPIKNTYQISVREHFGHCLIEDSLCLIDEGATEFPNTAQLAQAAKKYIREQRHYKTSHDKRNDIVIVSQSWEDINIVLRRVYDAVYLLKPTLFTFFTSNTRMKRIYKFIDINEDTRKPDDFYEFAPWWHFRNKVFKKRHYYHLFDSLYRNANLKPMERVPWDVEYAEVPKRIVWKKKRQAIRKAITSALKPSNIAHFIFERVFRKNVKR